jgi:hypothetical protein
MAVRGQPPDQHGGSDVPYMTLRRISRCRMAGSAVVHSL